MSMMMAAPVIPQPTNAKVVVGPVMPNTHTASLNAREITLRRRHSTMHDVVSAGVQTNALPFSACQNGLTKRDMHVLWGLVLKLGGEWICEMDHDGDGDRWAVVGHRQPETAGYTAFLVCRKQQRVTLIEVRLAANWKFLGEYESVDALAVALEEIIGRLLVDRSSSVSESALE